MAKWILAAFDLDGTLIDSAPQIVWAANLALKGLGRVSSSDVGPPLADMLAKASGLTKEHPEILQAKERFVECYDPIAELSKPWAGVDEALEELASSGLAMALATNKRGIPAMSVLRARRWDGFFNAGAYCIEDFDRLGKRNEKYAALADCASRLGIDPKFCAMVGDTHGDCAAAIKAGYGMYRHCPWGGHPAPDPSEGMVVAIDMHPSGWLAMGRSESSTL